MHTTTILQIFTSLVVLFAVDTLWLHIIGPSYAAMIRQIQGSPMRLHYGYATGAYIILGLAMWWFLVRPATWSWKNAAFLGLAIYGTFEFTNAATLQKWSPIIVAGDTAWGAILMITASWLTRAFIRYIRKI